MAAPIKNVKVGAINVAIWENKNGEFTTQSITITRTYKNKKGDFETTNSMRMQDIPLIKLALDEVLRFKYLKDTPSTNDTGF